MRFPIIVALLLSGTSLASSHDALHESTTQLVKRASALSVVETGLYNISNSTVALTKQIRSFDISQLSALQAANTAAVQTIYTAVDAIKTVGNLSLTDAVDLTPVIKMLASTTNQSITTIINKKPAFGGLTPVVLYNLQQQLNGSLALTEAVNTKLPKQVLSISAQQSAPIFQSLQMGIAAFMKPNVNTPQNSPELFRTSAASLQAAPSVVAMGSVAIIVALISVMGGL